MTLTLSRSAPPMPPATPTPRRPPRASRVDTAPPDTQITSGPSGLTNNASPSFAFSSEAGASFQCRLDSTQAAGWALLQFAQALQLALQ